MIPIQQENRVTITGNVEYVLRKDNRMSFSLTTTLERTVNGINLKEAISVQVTTDEARKIGCANELKPGMTVRVTGHLCIRWEKLLDGKTREVTAVYAENIEIPGTETGSYIVLYQSDIEGDRFDEATPAETLDEAKEIFRKFLDREFLSTDSPFTYPDQAVSEDRDALLDIIRNNFETEGDAETEFLVRDTDCMQRLTIIRIRKKI